MGRKRVVVGLESTSPECVVLTAVAVARALEAEVQGIFVEEIDALRLAELPFAALVERSGKAARLDPKALGVLLRNAAEHAEHELRVAAKRERVRASFGVRRGRLLGALQAEASDRDLIVVDSTRGGSQRAPRRGPVAVVLDRPEGATLLLDLAAALDRAGGSIIAVVPATSGARERAAHWADDRGRALLLVSIDHLDAQSAARAVSALPRRLMIVRRGGAWLDEEGLLGLRRELDCPVLMVS
jgi:hypothetical protein